VLDPFLGLGNTAIAAVQLGQDFVGIEMDQHYLKEAFERIRSCGDSGSLPDGPLAGSAPGRPRTDRRRTASLDGSAGGGPRARRNKGFASSGPNS
jgi:hypothetical protein